MRCITKQQKLSAPLIFMVTIILAILTGCSRDDSKKARAEDLRKAPAPVTIATAEEKSVPIQLRAVGNVKAFSMVSVKTQVGGELITVHFKEGQKVNAGDLLFTIDPAPFEAHLKQAEANLAKHTAELQNAKKQVERYGSVANKGYVSAEDYDQVRTNAASLEASVLADKAAIENAKLDLKYCYIRSPITGYTGELKVHRGNLIKANDNDYPMVTVNQTSPIYVAFSIPERNLPEVKRCMKTQKLEVLAEVSGVEGQPLRGELAFIDNSVDPGTGAIQLKATFTNQDTSLWPGQFVNVILTLGKEDAAVIVPSHAVQTGQQGQYVFVVRPDLIAEVRPVVVGRTLGDNTVIDKGIRPGDRVVTDGHVKLFPGAKVKLVKGVE